MYHDPANQARTERQARILLQRFRASHQYMKYRNRQRKDEKPGLDQKWPDRLELAFFQALIMWPPMGRRQLMLKEKKRGRNELIADYIEELTGEARDRKQVSSHIQVLKPFVEHDPVIMRYLSTDDLAAQSRYFTGRAASHHDTRRASSAYPVHAMQHVARPPIPAMTAKETLDLSKVKDQLDVFEPLDFQMFVQQKLDDGQVNRLHTYTQSIRNPLHKEIQLHNCQTPCQSPAEQDAYPCQNLERDFPLLAAMHRVRPLDCNVLFAQASLAFPDSNFKDPDGNAIKGVELGISFICRTRHIPVTAQVLCNNTFYQDGEMLHQFSSHNEVHLTQADDTDKTVLETQVKFGSTFWANKLRMLAMKLNNDANPNAKEEVQAFLDGIQASQEIVARTESGVEKLLVIYWRFRLSTSPTGRAYWNRLHLPPIGASSDYTVTAAEQSSQQHIRTERVDSVYADYNASIPVTFPADPTAHAMSVSQPALQSPFEYDTTTPSWPTTAGSFDETTAAMDFDNDFDFCGGNINISAFDPTLDFSTFDSSAFNFDEFPTDPTLQDYSQPAPFSQAGDYSQQATTADYSWDNYNFNDSQAQSVTGASAYPAALSQSHQEVFDGYASGANGNYEAQSQAYNVGVEGQAYGGARQDSLANV
ncbi:Regulatory abaA [Lecanosticta acicola]|uniref:Regulatory abaA n=1 Tax=Lecanosticta acicola TaxID=111012 RepID=A0AAI8YWA5_9PEZI|nr:Regulatory abaA [Lecanosticta acicola]